MVTIRNGGEDDIAVGLERGGGELQREMILRHGGEDDVRWGGRFPGWRCAS